MQAAAITCPQVLAGVGKANGVSKPFVLSHAAFTAFCENMLELALSISQVQEEVACSLCNFVNLHLSLLWNLVYLNLSLLCLCCVVAVFQSIRRRSCDIPTVPVSLYLRDYPPAVLQNTLTKNRNTLPLTTHLRPLPSNLVRNCWKCISNLKG